VNVQALKQTRSQKTSGLIQSFTTFLYITCQQAEKNLGVGVIGRDFHTLDRDHAHARVFQLTRNQFRQITLNLIGYFEGPVGCG
jgi:hypothetical protein